MNSNAGSGGKFSGTNRLRERRSSRNSAKSTCARALPIVYTSADSVFQVAAHEEVIPVPELYRICSTARELLRGPHEVGRVIARPFVGEPGKFVRTANRKDYAVPPPPGMLLDRLMAANVPVCGIGKISDIFLGRGISQAIKTHDNAEGMQQTDRE